MHERTGEDEGGARGERDVRQRQSCRNLTPVLDCGWSLLNHGVADIKRLNLGNLNPIYERELTKIDVHQGEGRWNVSKYRARR